MRWTELNEVVVVAADGACGLADGFDFYSRHGWQGAGKKLILDFPRDRNLILQPLPLVLYLDELADRGGHGVEGFCQFAQLVALLHLYPVGKISLFYKLGSLIQVGNGIRDAPGQYNPRYQRHDSDENKKSGQPDRHQPVSVTKFTE